MKKDRYKLDYSESGQYFYIIDNITNNVIIKDVSMFELIDKFIYTYNIKFRHEVRLKYIQNMTHIIRILNDKKIICTYIWFNRLHYKIELLSTKGEFYGIRVDSQLKIAEWENVLIYYTRSASLIINRYDRIIKYINEYGIYIKGDDI